MQASDLPGATELAAAQQPLQVCLTHGMQVVYEHEQHAHQQNTSHMTILHSRAWHL